MRKPILFSILFLIVIFLFGGIIFIKQSKQKPQVIFEGEAGPAAQKGICPFGEKEGILCIFMDDAVLKALNLPPPKNEKIKKIYQNLPRILQWRVMVAAYQKLGEEDKKLFQKYFSEQEGYEIQLLFYHKIPNYKQIIDEEVQRLRNEVMQTIYGENF